MYFKTLMILFFTTPLGLISGFEQASGQQNEVDNKVSMGFQLTQYQDDFGGGINLNSPWFANEQIKIRVRTNMMFHEHTENSETTWTPYINAMFGLAGKTGTIGEFIRLYGEGGVIGLFPSDKFSSTAFEFGGYGLFGFEFFFNLSGNYFIELGAVGTGAKADRIPDHPIYSNGFTISTGFRLLI